MFPRNRDPWLTIGLVSLIAAAVATRFLHPTPRFDDGIVDGLKGLLYGIAIGAMLVSVKRRADARRAGPHD
jgi:hypothetical protein